MKISKIFLGLAIFGFLTLAASALAATGDYVPLVQIPNVNTTDFLQYLSGIYNFLISIVGILAMASLVYGGFRYLTSVGNPAAVEDAKDIINSAIIGLVLALSSWLILNEINPDVLVTSRKPGITGQTWPGYKYNQPPSTRDCVADTNLEGAPVPNDTTKKKCRCVDDPTRDVTFTPPAAVSGPVVVSTTPVPCKILAPEDAEVTITFSEAMDAASLNASGTITIVPALGSVNPTISSVSMTGNTAKLILSGALLTNMNYTVTVNTSAKSFKGVAMANAYVFRFTTDSTFGTPCTPPPLLFADCTIACSNPLTPGLTPSGYHCLKADLRVGTTAHPLSDSVTINKGDSVYFDARSGSVSYAYPGLNLKPDPYVANSGFENGINRYEIKCVKSNPDNLCSLFTNIDYGCTDKSVPVGSSCVTLGALSGYLVRQTSFWGVCGLESITKDDAFGYPFNTSGTYTIELTVYAKDNCSYTTKQVIVNVNP